MLGKKRRDSGPNGRETEALDRLGRVGLRRARVRQGMPRRVAFGAAAAGESGEALCSVRLRLCFASPVVEDLDPEEGPASDDNSSGPSAPWTSHWSGVIAEVSFHLSPFFFATE